METMFVGHWTDYIQILPELFQYDNYATLMLTHLYPTSYSMKAKHVFPNVYDNRHV